MQGKTHLAVGSALALALLPPAGMHTLIIGTGAAALGSVVSDIDSGHSGAGQDAARVMAVSAIITILTVAAGDLIIGVYLDAEVLTGIDELDEQWELIAKALIVLLSDEQSFLLTHQLVEALAFIRAVGDDGLAAANT